MANQNYCGRLILFKQIILSCLLKLFPMRNPDRSHFDVSYLKILSRSRDVTFLGLKKCLANFRSTLNLITSSLAGIVFCFADDKPMTNLWPTYMGYDKSMTNTWMQLFCESLLVSTSLQWTSRNSETVTHHVIKELSRRYVSMCQG